MFTLEMNHAGTWHDCGSFDTISEAVDCMFDACHDYRVIDNSSEKVVHTQKKQYQNWRQAI